MISDNWNSTVRDYEVDFQGIVNNANYFHYLDNARALFFLKNGLNIKEYYDKGIDIVLISSSLIFKKSLSFNDKFLVKTTFKAATKIKFVFDQEIYLKTKDSLVLSVSSQNMICATKQRKPVFLLELYNLASGENI